jgi:hypothetical protein
MSMHETASSEEQAIVTAKLHEPVSNDDSINPSRLKPGVRVHISGQSSNFDNMALTAQTVEIRS